MTQLAEKTKKLLHIGRLTKIKLYKDLVEKANKGKLSKEELSKMLALEKEVWRMGGAKSDKDAEQYEYIIEPDYFAEADSGKKSAVKFWNDSNTDTKQSTIDANYLKVLEWREYPEKYFEEVLGFTAWDDPEYDSQLDIARAIRDYNRVSVRSGNGIGKTVVMGRVALWFLSCWPPSIVITTAPTHRQVEKQLWGEIRSAYKNAKIPMGGELLTTELRFEEGWYALGFATDDKNKFHGFHGPNMLVLVDEAGGMSEEIMEAIEGLLTSEGAKLLLIGNPTNPTNHFGRTHLHPKERAIWKKLHIDCWNTPNVKAGKVVVPGLCAPGWPAERKRVWGEHHPFYLVRVKGDFPIEGEKNLIPYHMVHSALERNISPVGQKVIAIDPARFGDDRSVVGRLWGEQFRVLKKYRKLDGPTLADRVIEWVEQEGDVYAIKVDEIGEGSSCFDSLKEKKRSGRGGQKDILKDVKIMPIRFNERCRDPKNRKNYANLRAKLGFIVRDMFEEGTIDIDDEDLGAQASGMQYDYERKGGRLILEDKREFKKRYRSSPDEFDCLLVAKASGLSAPQVL